MVKNMKVKLYSYTGLVLWVIQSCYIFRNSFTSFMIWAVLSLVIFYELCHEYHLFFQLKGDLVCINVCSRLSVPLHVCVCVSECACVSWSPVWGQLVCQWPWLQGSLMLLLVFLSRIPEAILGPCSLQVPVLVTARVLLCMDLEI